MHWIKTGTYFIFRNQSLELLSLTQVHKLKNNNIVPTEFCRVKLLHFVRIIPVHFLLCSNAANPTLHTIKHFLNFYLLCVCFSQVDIQAVVRRRWPCPCRRPPSRTSTTLPATCHSVMNFGNRRNYFSPRGIVKVSFSLCVVHIASIFPMKYCI